jgi:hypothetical protein
MDVCLQQILSFKHLLHVCVCVCVCVCERERERQHHMFAISRRVIEEHLEGNKSWRIYLIFCFFYEKEICFLSC